MIRTVCLVAFTLLASTLPARADPPTGLAERIESLRQDAGMPGMTIAIVENGKPTFVRGFGQRSLSDKTPVDARTLFMTGSTGKAITAAALAILVDEGKIKWEDRVIDHIPWFRLYDPYATREITVRDLMVHRSGLGLGAGDLLAVPRGQLSRKEAIRRLAFIKPAYSFRARYEYDNALYAVAGQLVEEVTGTTWEKFVVERIFRASGIMDGVTDEAGRLANPNRAYPHARIGAAVRGAGTQTQLPERDQPGASMAPAGLQTVSGADLAVWLQLQLARGMAPNGKRIWSERQANEMWKPVVALPVGSSPDWLKPVQAMFENYALGWNVRDYRGEKLVWHTGAVFGFGAVVVLLPERNIGFAMAINSEDGYVARGLVYELLDHYLGVPGNARWPEQYKKFYMDRIAAASKALAQPATPLAKVGPSLPLASYAQTYRDAWYGDVVVSQRDGGLWIDFTTTPRMSGRLVHYQYDTFRTVLSDPALENALVTFQLDAKGKIASVKMAAASPTADFSYDYRDLDLEPVAAAK